MFFLLFVDLSYVKIYLLGKSYPPFGKSYPMLPILNSEMEVMIMA